MQILLYSVASTFLVSLMSLVGIGFSLILARKVLDRVVFVLVGLSAGALIGGAFLHLIPEALEESGSPSLFLMIIAGFSLFFVIERVLHWHHCHKKAGECKVHTFTTMNLIGDGVHNFIDGLVIAASFTADVRLGITTTIAVITHEIPQEIGDFGVLVYGGFSIKKALFFNFLCATTAIAGAIIGCWVSGLTGHFTSVLLPFAAGGFIYIAASDLIPELHKEPEFKRSIGALLAFMLGILLMFVLKD